MKFSVGFIKDIIDKSNSILPDIEDSKAGRGIRLRNLIGLSIIEFLIIVLLLPITYESGIDAYLNNLVSGSIAGEPSPYMYFINTLIGILLSWMYNLLPFINWYFLFVFGFLFVGYVAIQYVFSLIKLNTVLHVSNHILIFISLLYTMHHIGFMRVAATIFIGGLLLLLISDEKRTKEKWFGAAFVFIAALINSSLLKLYIPFLIIVVGILIMKKLYKNAMVLFLAVLISIGFGFIDEFVFQNNSVFKNYEEQFTLKEKLRSNSFFRADQLAANPTFSKIELKLAKKGLIDDPSLLKAMANVSQDAKAPNIQKDTFDFSMYKRDIMGFLNDNYLLTIVLFIFVVIVFRAHMKWYLSFIGVSVLYLLIGWLFYPMQTESGQLHLFLLAFPFFLTVLVFYSIIIQKKLMLNNTSPAQSSELVLLIASMVLILFHLNKYKEESHVRYALRDMIHEYFDFMEKQNDEFYVRVMVDNPFYLYKNPPKQTNAYRLNKYEPVNLNKNKLKNYTHRNYQSIYNVVNNDIPWYFDTWPYNGNANLVFAYYKSLHPNCFYKRKVFKMPGGKPTLYKYTYYNAVPESSKYTLNNIDTTMFNAPDSTYNKLINTEVE